jgi:predicted nuclease of predicted toxin-antitoxin system
LHVQAAGLDRAADEKVWAYASKNNFIVVTKDVDFFERGLLEGYPPKVVLIRRGNCSTLEIESMLREHARDVEALSANENIACLVLS